MNNITEPTETAIDGMKYALKLIEKLRAKYDALGFTHDMLSIDRVLCDVENEIGIRVYREWRWK